LLLGDYAAAVEGYRAALDYAPHQRDLATAGRQAQDILKRQQDPHEAQAMRALLVQYLPQ
jgi:hypothetical protein